MHFLLWRILIIVWQKVRTNLVEKRWTWEPKPVPIIECPVWVNEESLKDITSFLPVNKLAAGTILKLINQILERKIILQNGLPTWNLPDLHESRNRLHNDVPNGASNPICEATWADTIDHERGNFWIWFQVTMKRTLREKNQECYYDRKQTWTMIASIQG